MATIRPFRGLRFSQKAGPLENLVAPPYDVISESQREELASKNPNNVVCVTLPESKPDDRSKYVKYAKSSAQMAQWRRDGILELDEKPAIYRYVQRFRIPGSEFEHVRTKVVVLLKVEPYEKGVVLPHEQTFPKHKEDRLRILEATRSHLECIYGLFEDPDQRVHSMIVQAPSSKTTEFETDEGVVERFETIDDPETLDRIAAAMIDKKVWIADGHHRYETAVHFRELQGERNELIPEDFMMMALSSMSDPGLVILPTHRIVKQMPVTEGELDGILQRRFNVRKISNSRIVEELTAIDTRKTKGLGVALPSGNGLFLALDRPEDVLKWIPGEESDRLKMLDVSILHHVIFDQLLGLKGLDFFSYTRDPDEALNAIKNGAGASFLMNPPSVDDMRIIALGAEKMPQKSTYYYPKLSSGLVMWSLADF